MLQELFTQEQKALLLQFSQTLNEQQKLWLAGYFAGLSANASANASAATPEIETVKAETTKDETTKTLSPEVEPASASKALTILYGSRTGNGENLAKKAATIGRSNGFEVTLKSMDGYKTRDLANEKNLLIIVSTHGEGEPPFAAQELYDYIHSKRAPKLNDTRYAVLALGDSSYFHFCKAGIDFDNQLEKLGAQRILQRATLDVDFAAAAETFINEAFDKFGGASTAKVEQPKFTFLADKANKVQKIGKANPFNAPVLAKVGLHGRGSDRQTIHIELSTEDKAELQYLPGDSAGIMPVNSVELIDDVLAATGLDAGEIVVIKDKEKKLEEALYKDFELSRITVDVLKRFAEKFPETEAAKLLADAEKLKNYIDGRDIVDLFRDYPVEISAEELIALLRPLQPRYYSISSSPNANPGEIHLTVGVVQYTHAGRDKKGTCSNYLSEVIIDDETVPLFIESNPNFRLPENAETPIIMVGAGTGIAPYRAFVQERELNDNSGKSWLFFGNRNFETEFLYQTEWQQFLKSGALTRMDVAFSRDGDKKVYVQDRIKENGAEIFKWLEEGAHIYICGDMKNMARAVQDALLEIVEKHAALSNEEARTFIHNLEKSRRLQLDVY